MPCDAPRSALLPGRWPWTRMVGDWGVVKCPRRPAMAIFRLRPGFGGAVFRGLIVGWWSGGAIRVIGTRGQRPGRGFPGVLIANGAV